jgi:3',5'-cyclic AMP phosphodiesterase CpdA
VGDLVNNVDKDQEWDELYDALGFIPRVTPMILLPGNHEYPNRRTLINPSNFEIFSLWRPQFTLPENGPKGLEETAYFLDFQGVRLIMLNGNELLKEQAKWLEQVLEKDPQAWTIAAIHQPIYSTGRRGRDQRRQNLFVPIFDQFSVDLVLQGHEHNYARTKPLVNGQIAANDEKNRGTVYVTSVCGPKTYSINSRYEKLMETTGTGIQLFHVIRVDRNTLTCEGFDATGNLYDRFELKK